MHFLQALCLTGTTLPPNKNSEQSLSMKKAICTCKTYPVPNYKFNPISGYVMTHLDSIIAIPVAVGNISHSYMVYLGDIICILRQESFVKYIILRCYLTLTMIVKWSQYALQERRTQVRRSSGIIRCMLSRICDVIRHEMPLNGL